MDSTYEAVKLTGHSATVITRFVDKRKPGNTDNIKNSNKSGRKYNGYMSPATSRKCKNMLDSWLTALEVDRISQGKGKWYRNQQCTFVTLTLPGEQCHNDKVIKRQCLNKFIQDLKRNQGVVTYFWRAEPQKNGKIHFHLLIDRQIHYMRVRFMWNNCIEPFGYIDQHEITHGNRNPNSTDIRSLKKVRNTKAYICKYVTKSEGGRAIDGRIWGCSDNLRQVGAYEEPINHQSHEVVEYLQSLKASIELSGDFYLHIICDVINNCKKVSLSVWKRFEAHYIEVMRALRQSQLKGFQESATSEIRKSENYEKEQGVSTVRIGGKSQGVQLEISAFFQSYSSTRIQSGPV